MRVWRMGFEVLEPILNVFKGIQASGLAQWLALIGIAIIAIVVGAYIIYGLVKLGKMIISLRVKEFTLLLLAIGAALLSIAVILP